MLPDCKPPALSVSTAMTVFFLAGKLSLRKCDVNQGSGGLSVGGAPPSERYFLPQDQIIPHRHEFLILF